MHAYAAIWASSQIDNPASHVNPFLGTEFFWHTFPVASLPLAMVYWVPIIVDAYMKGFRDFDVNFLYEVMVI